MRVHVVVPDGFDDPADPSGGNIYDRRVCAGLTGLGWDVRVATVPGRWPEPGDDARAALNHVMTAIPDGELLLIDGLIASPSAGRLLPHTRRLPLTVLLHMPLTTAFTGPDGAPVRRSRRTAPGPARAPHEQPRPGGGPSGVPGAAAAGEDPRDDPVMSSERAVLRAAAGVVVTSEWTRGQVVARFAIPDCRVHVARPGVDRVGIPSRRATAAPADGHLLCVGALARHKGQDVLVEALAELGETAWECVLAGPLDRDPRFVDALRARVTHLGLDHRIRLTGTLTGPALDRAYAAADLLVVPSRAETYGMVVTEALARGVPVLAADTGGLPEALGTTPDGARPGGLVPPGDPPALTAALARWLHDERHRDDLRAAARRRTPALPTWTRTVEDVAAALTATRRRPGHAGGGRPAGA